MPIYDMCSSNTLKRCVHLFLHASGTYNGPRTGRHYGDPGTIECPDLQTEVCGPEGRPEVHV